MSAVLALETSGPACSVCLEVDGNRFEVTHHVDRRHNELLLGMVDEVCERAGLSRRELTALAFGCGPGSFTGVRIAAASVQAISLALNIPVVPVASSLVLVHAALRQGLLSHRNADATTAQARSVLTAIRSRAELYYMAEYSFVDARIEVVRSDELCNSMDFLPTPPVANALLLGAAPQWWTGPDWSPLSASAADVLAAAVLPLQRGEAVASAQALPVYVKGDTPWRRQGKR